MRKQIFGGRPPPCPEGTSPPACGEFGRGPSAASCPAKSADGSLRSVGNFAVPGRRSGRHRGVYGRCRAPAFRSRAFRSSRSTRSVDNRRIKPSFQPPPSAHFWRAAFLRGPLLPARGEFVDAPPRPAAPARGRPHLGAMRCGSRCTARQRCSRRDAGG